jgi:hypothetical protein
MFCGTAISVEHVTQSSARSSPRQYSMSSCGIPSHERHRDLDAIARELNEASRDNENWFRQFLKSSSIRDRLALHKTRMQELRANFTVCSFHAQCRRDQLLIVRLSSRLSSKHNSQSMLFMTSWLPRMLCKGWPPTPQARKQFHAGQRLYLARDLRVVWSICQGLDCILAQKPPHRGGNFFSTV